jgi:hypothetical protein
MANMSTGNWRNQIAAKPPTMDVLNGTDSMEATIFSGHQIDLVRQD